ncbi:hypothetical protein LWF01_12165 [Saxibacter everestensis]|uniref:Uncharacterized protein n=1 Tax=Saxibacter everestensis TaxID=2909229 RepID=A0ABY8QPW8_9MICO|nr:hypothetical protein LWF01_12165 [Brevibacteriaceae bacterium ZFBP1038]
MIRSLGNAGAPIVAGSSAQRGTREQSITEAAPAPQTTIADAIRLWGATASLGAGLIHLSVVVANYRWWPPVGVGILLLAVAQLAWSVGMLRSKRVVMPRTAGTVTILSLAAWLALHLQAMPFGPAALRIPTAADAAALALQLGILISIVALFRSQQANARPFFAVPLPAAALLGTLFFGCVLVAALTTTGLAATDAGASAQPHGAHLH